MVFFIDLDDEDDDNNAKPARSAGLGGLPVRAGISRLNIGPPAFYNSITQAFACYPIVIAIVSALDLNTLDSLALACRQIRNGLLQFRTALLASTLRCVNEPLPVNPDETFRLRDQARNYWVSSNAQRMGVGTVSASSKPGPCARDLVGPCRNCGTIVCRNCVIKPPSHASLEERHRRLCQGCTRAPLATLVKPPLDAATTLASDTLRRAVCQCESGGVYLCQPCGRTMKAANRDYRSIWWWRYQYRGLLAEPGTAIVDRGVICGREQHCCMARDFEQEVYSGVEDPRVAALRAEDLWTRFSDVSRQPSLLLPSGPLRPFSSQEAGAGSQQTTAPGYQRHEIQGVGGVMEAGTIRMVRLGACVEDWEDERAGPLWLLCREAMGATRSWCGWCGKVIPGAADRDAV